MSIAKQEESGMGMITPYQMLTMANAEDLRVWAAMPDPGPTQMLVGTAIS